MLSTLYFLTAAAAIAATPLQKAITDPSIPVRAAVVIALDGQIGGSGNLTGAEADAGMLVDALSGAGFHWILPIFGQEATNEGIDAALGSLAALRLRPDDTALVYVVTHGARCPLTDNPDTQYLRTVDTTEGPRCWDNAVTDRHLLEGLRRSGAGNRVLVIDACQTAFGASGSAPLEPDPWRRMHLEEVVLRSTSNGLRAFQVDGHILFTRVFAHGLRDANADLDGNGAVTSTEIYDYVAARLRQWNLDQVPMRQETNVGEEAGVVLAGTPGRPTHAVLKGLPAIWEWSVGTDFLSLGPEGALPLSEGEALSRRDPLGVALKVRGLPTTPGYHDARAWVPGRQRGWPSVGASAGPLWTHHEPGGRTTGPLLATLRLHEQVLPSLSLSGDISGTYGLFVPHLVLAGETHWRRFTAEAGVRGGWLASEGSPLDDSSEEEASSGLLGGFEIGVRVGLARQWAATFTCGVDASLDYPVPDAFALASCQGGALWDPAESALAFRVRPKDDWSRRRRRVAFGTATAATALTSGLLYGAAWTANQRFWDLEDPIPDADLPAWKARTNALYFSSAGLGVATLALGGITVAGW